MFSRPGIETIHQFQCFSANPKDAKPPWEEQPKKYDVEAFIRMYKGRTRDQWKEEKEDEARKLGESSDEENTVPARVQ